MKKVIRLTESDLERLVKRVVSVQTHLLKENDSELWFKRRVNPEYLRFFIDKAIADEPNPCDEYDDEFDYAENRIDWFVTDFLSEHEESYNSDEYDDYYSELIDLCKEWFAEELFQIYRDKCEGD